jgi:hypothetical protein
MINTHIFRRAHYLGAIAATTFSLLPATQVNASMSQSRLLVSVTVVEMCHLNLNLSIQAQQLQQFSKLRDSTKTSSCDGPRTAPASNLTQHLAQPSGQPLVNVDALQRGFYNINVDESVGQMTLTF